MPTVRMTFTILGGLSLAFGIATGGALIKSRGASAAEAAAYENRYHSYLLADELRQSSDDLTRLGRTYVVTGDVSYKNQYLDILSIRNGEKPRPEAYNRIYWDFVAGGNAKPRPDGETVPLLTLMKRQGFTDAEFQQLEQAKKNSDGLVGLEVEAMNLVEAKDKDGKPLAAPDRTKAIELLHSKQYHAYKSQIMEPIDRFYTMLDARTQALIDEGSSRSDFWQSVSLGSIGLLVFSVFALCGYVHRYVVRSLSRFEVTTRALSSGDFEVPVEETGRRDEIGSVARSLLEFRDSMRRADELRRMQDEGRAARDLAAQRGGEMRRLADTFETSVGDIVRAMSGASSDLERAGGTLTRTAESTRSLSATVATVSEEASANVQSVASATQEMAASVNEISRQVQESSRIANEAVQQTGKADSRIAVLSEAAERIGNVVKLITDVAGQTNLLALNATIEAARAGEAGRGFAVVAQEVKALAAQTGKATDEIGTQIAGMQAATQEAVSAISEIGQTITRVAEIATSIAAAIEEQGAATGEIARNVQEAAQRTATVATRITEVNNGAGETGSASSNVLTSASQVANDSARLKAEVERFLTAVRAA